MFYYAKCNGEIVNFDTDKKRLQNSIALMPQYKNVIIEESEINLYAKSEEELEAEETQQTVNEIEAQLADMRERMVYAMLLGDDDLIQSIREEYSEVMNG